MSKILGILGGMGPMATIDFMTKITRATPAGRDQDHVSVITASLPAIPDRCNNLCGAGPSPFDAMLDGIRRLERAGAEAVAMPCNTAHCWHGELQAETDLPFFHIADAAMDNLVTALSAGRVQVGILATSCTLDAGIYHDRLTGAGLTPVIPDADEQERLVMRGIRYVKAGRISHGAACLSEAVKQLEEKGAENIILACTEIPPALSLAGPLDPAWIDATDSLAKTCVNWALGDVTREFRQAS